MQNIRYTFALLLLVASIGLQAQNTKKIVILHTNDTHSRIEPLPHNDKNLPNTGGVVRRANYIRQMRKVEKNVLLLDAGDFVQGTPYFNLFKGEAEVEAMNKMKYDAVTLGNHEFDYGLEQLLEIVKKSKISDSKLQLRLQQNETQKLRETLHCIEKEWVTYRCFRCGS